MLARSSEDRSSTESAGTVRRRRGLPGSRSAVGGLLVTVAMLGTWFVLTDRHDGTTQRHVIARVDLPAGHRITGADLDLVELDLPPPQSQHTFDDADLLVDSVTRGPVAAGELIQSATIGDPSAEAAVQFSFTIEREWAVGGSIDIGDRIDVYALDANDRAVRVLDDVAVQAVSGGGDGGPADTGRQTITVAETNPDRIGRVLSSIRTGTLTVVRVTDREDPGTTAGSRPATDGEETSAATDAPESPETAEPAREEDE